MKKECVSFDVNEPFFIYVEFFWEVIEDTNYLIAFFNPLIFFIKFYKAPKAANLRIELRNFLRNFFIGPYKFFIGKAIG